MANIHDLARKFLAGDGIKLNDSQKKSVFLFADFVLQEQSQLTPVAGDGASCYCQLDPETGQRLSVVCPVHDTPRA